MFWRPLAWLALLLAAAGCQTPRPPAEAPAAPARLPVVSTVLPVTLFTRAVAGDCATITALIPPGLSPHDFQARPADLAALRRARLLVKNGLGLEGFLDRLVAAADNPRLLVIDSSRSVATLPSPGHPPAARHDHGHAAVNPHIWLDPLRAVQQVEAIRDGLIQADPACAAGYRRRAATYTAQLRQLHRDLARQLRPYAGQTFIAFHDVAPYFAQRYNLRADYVVDVPEINPSAADLQRISAAVKASQLRALLSEPQQGRRSFNALAEDLGVKISVFDPLETASETAARDPATYLMVMRRNVAELGRTFAR